jgi:hypothetical protein
MKILQKKMVCEELKVRAKETKTLIARTYSPICFRAKLQQKQCLTPSGRKGMGPLKERHYLNKGTLKAKQLLRLMCVNVLFEVPPKHQKKT